MQKKISKTTIKLIRRGKIRVGADTMSEAKKRIITWKELQ